MPRFFCPPENISKDKIVITDRREIHHILDVLRKKKDDEVLIFDGENSEYRAIIEEISKNKLILKIKEKKFIQKEELEIAIGCAIPKRKRFDLVIEKLTELGVKRIIPLKTERTEVLISKERRENKLFHWQRIALNSAKQSKRIDIPTIESQIEFSQILNRVKKYDLCLICTICPQTRKIRDVLKESKLKSILILIGPEGDFTFPEVDLAIKKGFIPISLGDLVLRVETAAIAIVSVLNYVLNYTDKHG